jgi:hypothetical protein
VNLFTNNIYIYYIISEFIVIIAYFLDQKIHFPCYVHIYNGYNLRAGNEPCKGRHENGIGCFLPLKASRLVCMYVFSVTILGTLVI